MRKRTAIIIAGLSASAVLLGGAGLAIAGGDNDTETPIVGDALDRASAAALAHTDGGRVTETEQGDEESYYEVEVTLDDGTQVDVQLDRDFQVVGASADHEDDAGDDDGDD